MTTVLDDDVTIRGTLSPESINMPQNAISADAQIKAGTNISADKTQTHIYRTHAQPNTAATAETRAMFVARKAGTVKEVLVGSIARATGDSTTTVNVLKNGTTILSSSVVLNNANAKPAAQVTPPRLEPIIAARFQRFVLRRLE